MSDPPFFISPFCILKPLFTRHDSTMPQAPHILSLLHNSHQNSFVQKCPEKDCPFSTKSWVLSLLRLSVLIHKLRKPIIPKLLLLKKLRKQEEFNLLRHYNYGFLGGYQFSPSSTPLIHHHRNHFKNRGYRDLCSFFYLYWCLGNVKVEGGGSSTVGECQLEALPMPTIEIEDAIVAEDLFEAFDSGDEGESVDEKAERFIERFYQEMRMQRQESI